MATEPCFKESEPETVLVCDDDYMVRVVARAMFEHSGYRVLEAGTGEEALAILSAEPISALIIDVVLPGISGIDVCRKFREKETGVQIPIVVISGHEKEEYIEDSYKSGANVFQKKPVSWVMVPPAVAALKAMNVSPTVAKTELASLGLDVKHELKQGVLKPIHDAGKLLNILEEGEGAPATASAVLYKTAIKALREAEATLRVCLEYIENQQASGTDDSAKLTIIE